MRPSPAPGNGEKHSASSRPSAASSVRGLRPLPSSASPPQPPDRLERFIRNRPCRRPDRRTLASETAASCEAVLPETRARPFRPGCSSRDASRLPPGAPPSGEGTATRIERRAPEGVEVVPEALFSSSAATGPLRNRCPPGLSDRRANRTALPPHVAYRREASQKGQDQTIIIAK